MCTYYKPTFIQMYKCKILLYKCLEVHETLVIANLSFRKPVLKCLWYFTYNQNLNCEFIAKNQFDSSKSLKKVALYKSWCTVLIFKWLIHWESIYLQVVLLSSAVAKQEHMNQMLMNQMQNLASMVQGGGGPGGFSDQGGYGE